ncbi:MAG TPA: DbpA RNA binding domain-containing protein [Gemmatimonadales bacterium]|nr:DbpA RNA binding domain-containing protein [Gemmatimonadales bacterium]
MTNYADLIGPEMADIVASRDPRPELKALVDGILPIAARGNNAVLVAPPSTTYAYGALAGVFHHLREGEGTRGLVLVPEGTLEAWHGVADSASLDLAVHIGAGQARAARGISSGQIDILVTTLATATALQQRATLKVDALRSVVLVWPELWGDTEPLAALMADAKEAQRVVITSDLAAAGPLIERYARKAIAIGAPAADAPALPPLGPVRTVVVPEQDREMAVRAIEEVLDPATLLIEGACAEDSFYFGPELPAPDAEVTSAKAVVAWDLPTRAHLERLLAIGPVVVLLPAYAERWAAANLGGRKPLRLPNAVDAARTEAARRREQVTELLGAGEPTEGLLALAPLFERYDASLVAAALYQLAKVSAPIATPTLNAPAANVATGTMWVSAGAADGLQPKDIVGALVNECKVDRTLIGKVDVREKFTLVVLPAGDVERIAQAFTGTTLKRKRVLARPDRERPAGERPARGDRPRAPRGDRPPRKRD